jgi:hypothetical protein
MNVQVAVTLVVGVRVLSGVETFQDAVIHTNSRLIPP